MKKIIALFLLILCTQGLFSSIQENETNSKKEVNQNNEKGLPADSIFEISVKGRKGIDGSNIETSIISCWQTYRTR